MAEKRLVDIEKSDRVREKDYIIAIIDGCLRKVEMNLIDSGGGGVTVAQANSLWAIIQKTAFATQLTETELTNFKNAFGIEGSGGTDTPVDPTATLSSISATYTGGDATVGTAVSALTGITVKATYSDGSTKNVTGYTLSGTIAEGSNTITVSYGGKTTTFTVTGVAESSGEDENAVVYNVFDGEYKNTGYSGELFNKYGMDIDVYSTKIDVVNANRLYWRIAHTNKVNSGEISTGKLFVHSSDDTLLGAIDISSNVINEHAYFISNPIEGMDILETLEDGTIIYTKNVGSVSLEDYPNKAYVLLACKRGNAPAIAKTWKGNAQSTSPLTLEGWV